MPICPPMAVHDDAIDAKRLKEYRNENKTQIIKTCHMMVRGEMYVLACLRSTSVTCTSMVFLPDSLS